MTNELDRARLADLVDSVRAGIASIAQAQQQRAQLTATASAAHGRVTVVVNADGVVIETRFADTIEDLTYTEIAHAVTSAVQDAAAQVQRKTQALLEPLKQDQARIPKLSEFLAGMPDVHDMLPTPPPVSTAPPAAHDRTSTDSEDSDGSMVFCNVEQWDHEKPSREESFMIERPW
ncbi:YbaB/EbfC family nucleoid-associated protein [Nocardia sp. CA-107356]|uniref:YbaB/EbfC family nucleoid-associated protein n=1 Tax=Nocardia sp. CA-107356 TaxID=3239972 RepID=UPI003D8F6C5C